MAVGAVIGAVGSVAGLGLSVAGTIMEAQANARRAREEAENRRIQATEINRRSEVNIEVTRRQFARQEGETYTAYAAGNVDVGSGSALQALVNARMDLNRAVINQRAETAGDVNAILKGAERYEAAGRGAKKAAAIGAAGTILGGAGDVADALGALGKKNKG